MFDARLRTEVLRLHQSDLSRSAEHHRTRREAASPRRPGIPGTPGGDR
jgi:hypothetical protein